MRGVRHTFRNVVIVCEGSDTEYHYMVELGKYVMATNRTNIAQIHVVPTTKDKEIQRDKGRTVKLRKLKGPQPAGHYWHKVEWNQADYAKYAVQPCRYVREAQLFCDEDGYTEGWAVYDKDVHTGHRAALNLQKSDGRLHIAYSGYSFEEWILLHFERNDKAFQKSDCEDADKKSLMCGTGQHPNDCHGNICIAGRIREAGYIPQYQKEDEDIFNDYTKCANGTLSPIPFANAAWTRQLPANQGKPICDCNPYTNVDVLVRHLTGFSDEYVWHKLDLPFSLMGTEICLHETNACVWIEVVGNRSYVLTQDTVFLNVDFGVISSLMSSRILLHSGERTNACPIPTGAVYVSVNNANIHHIFVL